MTEPYDGTLGIGPPEPERVSSLEEFIKALGADLVIPRNEDGSYTCTCGTCLPTALMLWQHRRHDHE